MRLRFLAIALTVFALGAAGNAATLGKSPVQPLGTTTVAAAGTPVSVASLFTVNGNLYAKAIVFEASSANTGNVYIVLGSAAAAANHTNVVYTLAPGATYSLSRSGQDLNVLGFYLDSATSGNTCDVTIIDWSNF